MLPTTSQTVGIAGLGVVAVVAPIVYYRFVRKTPAVTSAVLQPKVPKESKTEVVKTLLANQCTSFQVCYGGELLAMMDMIGGAVAFKHSEGSVVTASMEAIHFLQPAKLSELVIMHGKVSAAFNTSMEVEVIVEVENPLTGDRTFCCRGLMTFVALDEAHRPRRVPALLPETAEERRAVRLAVERRKGRRTRAISFSSVESRWEAYVAEHGEIDRSEAEDLLLPSEKKRVHFMHQAQAETSYIVMPQHANHLNITFGGQVVKWMEQVASICAVRTARKNVVTVGVDQISFNASSQVGNILKMKAQVNRIFSTSMEIGVHVEVKSKLSAPIHCNSAYFTFVSVDSAGAPTNIGRHVIPDTFHDRKRFMEAFQRRQARIAARDRKPSI